MGKAKRARAELRYYDVPQGISCLALLGDTWKRNYGNDAPRLHFHNLTEIGFCRYGTGTLQDGARVVQPYTAGTFTLFPANVPHNTFSKTETQIDYWEYLFMDMTTIANQCCADELAAGSMMERLYHAPHIFQTEQNPELGNAIREIMEEMRSPDQEFARQIVAQLLPALLLRFARLAPADTAARPIPTGGGLQICPALEYVFAHYAEPLRIEELAQACHLSETHFRRVFLENVNMSPLEFINAERIQRACERLRKTDESMEMIALKTGFSSQSSFNRTFLKMMGTTPHQWKKQNRTGEIDSIRYLVSVKEGWV